MPGTCRDRRIVTDSRLLPTLLCTALLLGMGAWGSSPAFAQVTPGPTGTEALPGSPVPAFAVESLEDSTRTFEPVDFEGKYLLMNLWAVWCTPCLEKIPALKKIRSRYDRSTLTLLNVSMDGSRQKARKLVEERGMPGTHAYAGQAALGENFGASFATVAPEEPQMRGLPNVTLVAPDGEVLARLRPPADGLRDSLRKHLPAPASTGE